MDAIPFIETPLHIAAAYGHVEYAMEIMRLKPELARKLNLDGFTPLHFALQMEYIKMVLWLVEMDKEMIRVKAREGLTALHYVAHTRNLLLLDRFLSACPSFIEDATIRNETTFHLCLKNNGIDAFEVLIDRLHKDIVKDKGHVQKGILNVKDIEGNTILHIAVSKNQLKVLQLLLNYNSLNPRLIQLNVMNDDGLTALDLARFSNFIGCESLLHYTGAQRAVSLNGVTSMPTPKPLPTNGQTSSSEPNLSQKHLLHLERYFKFDFEMRDPNKVRMSLLTISVIMATTTFRAGISPPFGVDTGGIPTLAAYPFSYILFMFFNTTAFFVSLNTIRVLIHDHPMF